MTDLCMASRKSFSYYTWANISCVCLNIPWWDHNHLNESCANDTEAKEVFCSKRAAQKYLITLKRRQMSSKTFVGSSSRMTNQYSSYILKEQSYLFLYRVLEPWEPKIHIPSHTWNLVEMICYIDMIDYTGIKTTNVISLVVVLIDQSAT